METSSSGSSQGSILGPLSLTIYISDLPNELKSNAKLFADATSLFTIVKDKNESSNTLNNDLSLISKWAFSWKILFNPDPSKPAHKVLFSRKRESSNSSDHKPQQYSGRMDILSKQKHLGILLD